MPKLYLPLVLFTFFEQLEVSFSLLYSEQCENCPEHLATT